MAAIEVPWWRTKLGEEEAEAARRAVAAGQLSQGAITARLEARLADELGVPFVTLTTSGTVALVMALVACGVGPGDEVIVPNRTFIATAHAAQLLGARVRLVDTVGHAPLIDPERVEEAITPRTRAVLPVHLNGRACDLERLGELAERHGLVLIEDACQALYSRHRGRYLGTFGQFGCFSLGVTKLVTSGQGGFVVTADRPSYERLQLMRSHGVPTPLSEHFPSFGFNFRYTDIQAAVATVQLDRAAEKIGKHVDLYRAYEACLASVPGIGLLPVDLEAGELPLWVEVLCERREELLEYLGGRGIQARRATPNLSDSPHLSQPGPFPRSDRFARDLATLPCGPDQEPTHVAHTLAALQGLVARAA